MSHYIGVIEQTNTEIVAVLRGESDVLTRIQCSFHRIILTHDRERLQPIDTNCFTKSCLCEALVRSA